MLRDDEVPMQNDLACSSKLVPTVCSEILVALPGFIGVYSFHAWACSIPHLFFFLCFCFVVSSQQDQASKATSQQTCDMLAAMMSTPIDPWMDADMESVVKYLRSNKRLAVPQELRSVLGMNSD